LEPDEELPDEELEEEPLASLSPEELSDELDELSELDDSDLLDELSEPFLAFSFEPSLELSPAGTVEPLRLSVR
jgi:hypothetical protein